MKTFLKLTMKSLNTHMREKSWWKLFMRFLLRFIMRSFDTHRNGRSWWKVFKKFLIKLTMRSLDTHRSRSWCKHSMEFLLKLTMRFWGGIYCLLTLTKVKDIDEDFLEAHYGIMRGICFLTLRVNRVDKELSSNLMWGLMCDT